MKAKVYIETTIPSYLIARPSRDLLVAAHQQLTRDWWESRRLAFDLYVSEPVMDEAAAGDAVMAKKRLELLANIPVLALRGCLRSPIDCSFQRVTEDRCNGNSTTCATPDVVDQAGTAPGWAKTDQRRTSQTPSQVFWRIQRDSWRW
jgi:hypothetical protein